MPRRTPHRRPAGAADSASVATVAPAARDASRSRPSIGDGELLTHRSAAHEIDYRALFEAAPGLFVVLDPDLRIVAVSDAYLAATMTVRGQIIGRGIFDVFPDNPDDPTADGAGNLHASLDRVRERLAPDTMAVQKYDIRRPDPDGGGFEVRYWSPINSPVLDGEGRLRWIVHRVEDVTDFVRLTQQGTEERRLTEELATRAAEMEAEVFHRARDVGLANAQLKAANLELLRSETFLDSVVQNIPDMVFVKDAATLRFVRINRAGERLLGARQADLIGKSDYDLFPADEADFFTAKDREVLDAGHVLDIPEEPIDTPHGRRILHTKKIPVVDEGGRPIYLLGISEDITERKRADDDIRVARAEAERSNRAKTEFLSRMSHELRTPLNAILGFSQLLEMDELTRDQHENVGYIGQAGRHLLQLINEVLDISRIESGRISISREPVAVAEVVMELAAIVRPLADARAIHLDMRVDRSLHVLADRQRLNQVLLNLLSNAVKYNRENGSIRVDTADVATGRTRIIVTDTGYGIKPQHIERLFRPFDRLGAEQSSVEGTGMGLALSKALAEAMGGSLGVTSTLDVGTSFWIELERTEPLSEVAVTPTTALTEQPDRGPFVILHIEDNPSSVLLVERIVGRRQGTEVVSAALGSLGMDLARRHRPALILLDLHLPDMAGLEVLRLLQSYPETRDLPVVVMSADRAGARPEQAMDAGAFDFIAKPLDVTEFLAIVDRLDKGPS
jgi:PAS domain S-box-containing protein